MKNRKYWFALNALLGGLLAYQGSAHSSVSAIYTVDPVRCERMKNNNVLSMAAPAPCARLRVVQFSYVDFEGNAHRDGEIVVLDAVAKHVQMIFDALFDRAFPIATARPMEHYRGDDDASMADNNTSALNDRAITHGDTKSIHAYGLAIDLNPIQNPYIAFAEQASGQYGSAQFKPAAGVMYTNRLSTRPEKPQRTGMSEKVIDLFADHGFLEWGGYWDTPIDYQHFQVVSRAVANRLVRLPFKESEAHFNRIVDHYRQCKQQDRGAARRIECVVNTRKAFAD